MGASSDEAVLDNGSGMVVALVLAAPRISRGTSETDLVAFTNCNLSSSPGLGFSSMGELWA